MDLSDKVNTALDETRMLMLGAQILLGFQLRGAFAEGFERLPQHTQSLDAVGTGLMVVVVGLLITPGPYHRIVEGGSDSDALHDVVTAIAALALFPFALALGIDVFIAGAHFEKRSPEKCHGADPRCEDLDPTDCFGARGAELHLE